MARNPAWCFRFFVDLYSIIRHTTLSSRSIDHDVFRACLHEVCTAVLERQTVPIMCTFQVWDGFVANYKNNFVLICTTYPNPKSDQLRIFLCRRKKCMYFRQNSDYGFQNRGQTEKSRGPSTYKTPTSDECPWHVLSPTLFESCLTRHIILGKL